ncbi:uncharacterized protein BDR25DRAFT_186444, partial [Lindgomyces ingoldianus]
FRPLLPQPPGGRPDRGGAQPPYPPSTEGKKRKVVTAACNACRKRKTKCDAQRPRCSVCISRNADCDYDTVSTETHSQALKRKFDELQQSKSTYEQIFDMLKARTEQEATIIMQRIRNGVDADTIIRHVEDGDLLLQLSLVPETRYRYDFPFITDMPSFLQLPDNVY